MPDITTTWMDGHEFATKYDVEYIANSEKWKIVCSGKHDAPWDLYEHTILEDFSDAMAWFCTAMFRQDIFDVKMMESTYLDGKLVRERSFVLPGSFIRSMELAVNDTLRRYNENLSAQHDEDAEFIADAMQFLEEHNAKKMFRDFRYEKNRSK